MSATTTTTKATRKATRNAIIDAPATDPAVNVHATPGAARLDSIHAELCNMHASAIETSEDMNTAPDDDARKASLRTLSALADRAAPMHDDINACLRDGADREAADRAGALVDGICDVYGAAMRAAIRAAVASVPETPRAPDAPASSADPSGAPSEADKVAMTAEMSALRAKGLDQACAAYDPRGATKAHAAYGETAVKRARLARRIMRGTWTKAFMSQVYRDMRGEAEIERGISPDVDKDVKTYVFVSTMSAYVPGVASMPYGVIAKHLLPLVTVDMERITGEVNIKYIDVLERIIRDQLADGPRMTAEECGALVSARRAELAAGRPKTQADDDLKKAEAKAARDRDASQGKIRKAISDAIVAGHADPTAVKALASGALADHGATLPEPAPFNPADMSVNDALAIATALFGAGRFHVMRTLRDRLNSLLTAVDSGLVETKEAD
jgi:hypothetical protein